MNLSYFSLITTIAFAVGANAVQAQTIKGAGASFPEILYQKYQTEYQRSSGTEFKYSSIGSGGGIRFFINQAVDVGSSTLIPTPIEKSQMEDGLVTVPTAGGAIAIVYNLQNVTTDIKISRKQLAKIFTGEIGNWSQISARLPDKKIQVVTRSDNSGTTFLLTRYLNRISDGKIAASRQPDWGFELYAQRAQDSGVAAEVRRIDGAIGYVQASFAAENNLPMARLENLAGKYARPNVEETKKALANIEFNEDFTIANAQEPEEGYPLVGLTWLLIPQKYPTAEAKEATQEFITWILTSGQEFNEDLEYTRIPENTSQKVIELVNNDLKVRPY
ncbi:phosphate ABC transporter, phosphate-binding protein [Xenococcus sp. PCC 7305]|uniref:phosphate ABC transporter substrate-binding protein PstS n=1 Tax=Xenococcus sp. PCC 7305 TaxID=102125 RepID=UPI0002ABA31B|nr:phosphate ABC transporter substrate-binding protein PstS [Xenococcus sp. PCC 7305]ELS03729.1 phosphate ABC transporter, phosphate-binding protein [Xenococcus sp. PCC 7305]